MTSLRRLLATIRPTGISTGPPATGAPGNAATPDAWLRWIPVWHALFYGLLGLATLGALLDPGMGWPRRWPALALSILLAAWYWVILVAHPERPHRRLLPILVYFAGAVVCFALLTGLHPAYMLLTFALFSQVYGVWPLRLAVPGSIVLALVVWWRNAALSGEPLRPSGVFVLIFVVAVVVGGLLGFYIDAIIRQSDDRRRLLEEIERTRDELAAAERRTGVLAERERLAREIHDTLAQGFASIVMHLEAAEQALPNDVAGVQRHLDQARRTARDNLAEARRLVWALRPEPLDGASVPEAVARLAARWSEASGVPASTAVAGTTRPLHPEVEVTLLRAAQEALANVRKHAEAARVALTLTYMDDLVALDVRDDGAGFDPSAVIHNGHGGYGLVAMRERAAALGGAVSVESEPGAGTTVALSLPAVPPAEEPGR